MKTLGSYLLRVVVRLVKVVLVGCLVPLLAVLAIRMLSPSLLLAIVQFLQELDTIPVWGTALIFASALLLLCFVIGPDLIKQTRKNKSSSDVTPE